ncbi:MAG TPA: restriction endonuclease subunit S [Thiomonas arsenitoxydans]|uniref:restriction endonuclease subunit S n=1 Tax=Thiomonas TaxID=32012 RepID=UPI00257C9212|nr:MULTISPECIES: restriction endonuclease subunit S [Thiomonas]HML82569.1 restriction endonuclease subunit S [Thiomonas arsenitoxydans]
MDSTNFTVVRLTGSRSKPAFHPRFAYYLLHGYDLAKLFYRMGGGLRQSMKFDDLKRMSVVRPPPPDQERIASFLDEKTARIDALIAEKERLLDRLREYHLSTTWSLVTKGCNPANVFVPTDVDWIGETPSNWVVKKLKWLTPVARGASPRPIDDPKFFDESGTYAWVRIADVSASDGLLTKTEQQMSDLGASLSVKLEPGALFLSIAGTVGKPCIAGIRCCIHDGFVWFPAIGQEPLRDWLFSIFEAGFAYAGLGKMGTQLNLNTDTVGGISIPVPPPAEMQAALSALKEAKAANTELQSHVIEHISLLREYRSSLISAAVTGQLNINDFQPRQLEAA